MKLSYGMGKSRKKGLEFDEVIIPSADSAAYHTDFDRNLLYVACTRAMHRLSLIFSGECTRLIQSPERTV